MKLPIKVDLTGTVAVVTGGGGVLMRVFAAALGESGAKVAVLDIDGAAAERTAAGIPGALAVQCDCLDKAALFRAKERVNAAFGRVGLLVNGAGGNSPVATTDNEEMTPGAARGKDFFSLDEKGFRFVFDLNLTTAFLATQVFAADMVEGGGNIINVSSMNAFRPLTKIPAYSAAKAGIGNFTEWLACHFAPCGVRANAIAPGFFATEQNRALLFREDGSPTPRTGKILANTPMKRFGVPEDLVGALLFLASDEASGFVTGTTIPVDGGFNAYSGV